jgi:antitoxin component of MazEF toxin-antitoxin module
MANAVAAVRRWGCSRAVVISQQIQKQLTWSVREVIHVSVEDDCIVLRPIIFPERPLGTRVNISNKEI